MSNTLYQQKVSTTCLPMLEQLCCYYQNFGNNNITAQALINKLYPPLLDNRFTITSNIYSSKLGDSHFYSKL